MRYYEQVLQPNESVKFSGQLHWVLYAGALLISILAGLIAIAVDAKVPLNFSPWYLLLGWGVITLLAFFRPWLRRNTTEIVVTDKRVIFKEGWIGRRTREINITKIETVDVNQGILGRVLGFGTVKIIGVGASWEPLDKIGSPLELRNAILVG